jgi:hypothetical protein
LHARLKKTIDHLARRAVVVIADAHRAEKYWRFRMCRKQT